MRTQASALGLSTINEAFPDRGYLANGQLAPRTLEGAILDNPERVAERAVKMATGQPLGTLNSGEITIKADTLCLHGDHPHAAENALAVRRALVKAEVEVRAF